LARLVLSVQHFTGRKSFRRSRTVRLRILVSGRHCYGVGVYRDITKKSSGRILSSLVIDVSASFDYRAGLAGLLSLPTA